MNASSNVKDWFKHSNFFQLTSKFKDLEHSQRTSCFVANECDNFSTMRKRTVKLPLTINMEGTFTMTSLGCTYVHQNIEIVYAYGIECCSLHSQQKVSYNIFTNFSRAHRRSRMDLNSATPIPFVFALSGNLFQSETAE